MLTQILSGLITRPADTTTYTAGDVVGAAALSFGPTGPSKGQGGELRTGALISSQNATTKPDLELWLFSANVASVTADNAAFAPTDAELATLIGVVPFPVASWKVGNTGSAAAGNSACVATGINIPLGVDTVYAVVVVKNAYVPVSTETFTINLGLLREY